MPKKRKRKTPRRKGQHPQIGSAMNIDRRQAPTRRAAEVVHTGKSDMKKEKSMANAQLAKYWKEFHHVYLQDAPPAASVNVAITLRKMPPGAAKDLLDFVAARVTVADVRAWMIEAGAELPGALKAEPGKQDTGHGSKTKDAFIVTMICGHPFMTGLFSDYKDAVQAAALADMPTQIQRYAIPMNGDGDYCPKCVDLVVKAHSSIPMDSSKNFHAAP